MGHPGTLEDNQISRDSVDGDNMAESKSNKAGQCIEMIVMVRILTATMESDS